MSTDPKVSALVLHGKSDILVPLKGSKEILQVKSFVPETILFQRVGLLKKLSEYVRNQEQNLGLPGHNRKSLEGVA